MSQTINRALDIMELFLAHHEGGMTLTEIAQATKLNPATALRYVSTLKQRGYLTKIRSGRYQLGLKTVDFSYANRRNMQFIDFTYLPLNRLSKEEGCDTYLTVLDNFTSLVVEEIGNSVDMRINSPVGKRMPLHSTACGKVHLAFMPEKDRQAFYHQGELTRFTKNTQTDPGKLETEVEQVRREGVAYDREEHRLGVWVAGAPIYGSNGKIIAAAGIITPVSQMKPTTAGDLTVKLISCTGKISQILGRI